MCIKQRVHHTDYFTSIHVIVCLVEKGSGFLLVYIRQDSTPIRLLPKYHPSLAMVCTNAILLVSSRCCFGYGLHWLRLRLRGTVPIAICDLPLHVATGYLAGY